MLRCSNVSGRKRRLSTRNRSSLASFFRQVLRGLNRVIGDPTAPVRVIIIITLLYLEQSLAQFVSFGLIIIAQILHRVERLSQFGEWLHLELLLISLCTAVLEEVFFAQKHGRTDREPIDDFVSILEHGKES